MKKLWGKVKFRQIILDCEYYVSCVDYSWVDYEIWLWNYEYKSQFTSSLYLLFNNLQTSGYREGHG